MPKLIHIFTSLTLTLMIASLPLHSTASENRQLPEFTQNDSANWINSAPLSRNSLLGKVVLLDIWTFECWNCYRSFPWLIGLEKKFPDDDFIIVGVHSPEFEREKNRRRVSDKVKEFGRTHPVMIDNDFSYWRALGNRYWPQYYLVDREGRIRDVFAGETHDGDARAIRIESGIRALLAEKADSD